MANIYRVTFTWSGFTGAPGYTNLFFDDSTGTAQAAVDLSRAFMIAACGSALNAVPSVVKIDGPTTVDTIKPATGSLVNSTTVTPGAQISPTGSGTFASASGACISWLTSAIVNGHRVRGRTFIVPGSTNMFGSNGSLAASYQSALAAAGAALIAGSPDLVVWRRPVSQAAGGGGVHTALVGKVSPKTAVLTSRRD